MYELKLDPYNACQDILQVCDLIVHIREANRASYEGVSFLSAGCTEDMS